MGGVEGEADEFQAVGRFVDDFEAEAVKLHHCSLCGNLAGLAKDVAGEGLVFVVLWEVKVVFFVDVFYFRAPGEFIDARGNLSLDELHVVVLVLYVAEYFLHKVLKCHHARRAAEFVDDYRDGTFLSQEAAHHFVGHEGFGGEHHRLEAFAPMTPRGEQLAHVDVAEHIVDVLAVDDYL